MKKFEYSRLPGEPEIVISPPDKDGEIGIIINAYELPAEAFIPFSKLKEWVLEVVKEQK